MMTRKALIDSLKESLKLEEGASVTYLAHLSRMVSENVDGDIMEPIRTRILDLIQKNKGHQSGIVAMLAKLAKEPADGI